MLRDLSDRERWELPAEVVDAGEEGVAGVAASGEQPFGLGIERRRRRPSLQPRDALGFLEQGMRVLLILSFSADRRRESERTS